MLALHSLACVAGFMAGWVRPGEPALDASQRHDAGPLAIVFVAAATLFSLLTQAYALGHGAPTSRAARRRPHALLLALLPHALPELFARLPAARRLVDRQPPRRLATSCWPPRSSRRRSRSR